MLVGHFAVGLIGKSAAPKVSLGTLTLASMLPDLLGFVFLMTGQEHWRFVPGGRGIESVELYDIALSHSLAMDLVWALLLAGLYYLLKRYKTGAFMLFVGVMSHWVLDFISHRPDMPLSPGAASVYGLGLWSSFLWTMVVEGGLWLVALLIYLRTTKAKRWVGVLIFWPVVALLTLSWISNFTVAPPPVSQSPVSASIVALGFFSLMIAWAYGVNRLRPLRSG